jgi:cysteine dioxygenase
MRSIDQFVEGLCRIPERDFDVPRVAAYIGEEPVDEESLERFSFFQPTHYTRNLIYKCGLFEVLAICWDVGQASAIHNHQGQNCWMSVPIGRLAVQNYDVLGQDAGGYCALQPAERLLMDPGHPSYVDNDRPIHAVLNLAEFNSRALSLHVYSRPYDRCLVYTPEQKSYREVPLFYDSEYGRRNAQTIAHA